MGKERAESAISGVFIGVAAFWICFAAFVLPKVYGPVILPDEFGYWAQAAEMAGYDWHDVSTKCSYYSFGYGIVMFPLLKLINNPVLLYRLFVGGNFLLLVLCSLLLYEILKKKICNGKKLLAVISGVTMLYAAYGTYAQTTMSETLLVFLYLLVAWQFMQWLKKTTMCRGFLLLATAGYMYLVHMRNISILLITMFCMVIVCFEREKKGGWKTNLLFLFALVIFLIVAGYAKNMLINRAGTEGYRALASANDYAGQLGKIKVLFSLKGIVLFLSGIAGKLFYLGCASFGLYYWGIAFLIKKLWAGFQSLRKKEVQNKDVWFYAWILLTHVGALLITVVFCLDGDRLDGILYGRYHENTLPIILALGMVEIISLLQIKNRIRIFLFMQSICFFAVYMLVGLGNAPYMNRPSVTGIIYAAQLADNYTNRMLLYAYLVSMAGGILILLTNALQGVKGKICLLTVVSLLWLATMFFSTRYMSLSNIASQKADAEALSQVRQILCREGRTAFYLYRGSDMNIYYVQYLLRDYSLVLGEEEDLKQGYSDSVIFIKRGDEAGDILKEHYENRILAARFEVYY